MSSQENQIYHLAQRFVDLLISRNYHISFAESCTGGLLASSIVSVSNASKVLGASFITYSEQAKANYAHVSPATIDQFGVVSEQVAAEMAEGVALEAKSEIGVGITGIAGPTGGTPSTPVGTVCFGFCMKHTTITTTVHFGTIGRNTVRKESVKYALEYLLKLVN